MKPYNLSIEADCGKIQANRYMFLGDTPIKLKKDDLLHRLPFAERLGKSLIEWKSEESIVIGLYGAWGSGKSSIVELAISFIENQVKKDEKPPIVIKFNPWNFTEQNQLITAFLTEVSKSIRTQDNSKEAIRVGEQLITYSKFFVPILFLLSVLAKEDLAKYGFLYQFTQYLPEVFKGVGNAAKSFGELKKKTLEEYKDALDKSIKKLNRKIIIVIDDIDRLNETEIKQVFQLVKLNANFPNTIYLLSFDNEKVIKALGDTTSTGKEYLEKIVQVAFNVPILEKVRLEEILFKELDKILDKLPNTTWDGQRWGNFYHSGFGDLFTSIRQVKRYINSLAFNINHIPDEINLIDFMGIEAIRVFSPEIYAEISQNKELFTSVDSSFSRSWSETHDKKREKIDKILSVVDEKIKPSIKGIILDLFPQVNGIYGNTSYGYDFVERWNKEKRICGNERFNMYFYLVVPKGEISQKEIDEAVKLAGNLKKLEEYLRKLIKVKKVRKLFQRLPQLIDVIPIENTETFSLAVFNVSDEIPRELEGMLDFGIEMDSVRIAYHLIKRIDDPTKRLDILENLVNKSASLDIPTRYVSLEEKKERASDDAKRLVDDDGYQKLKQSIIKKIKAYEKDGKLGSTPTLGNILYRWKEWETEQEPKQFVDKLITSNEGVMQLLDGFTTRHSSQGIDDKVAKLKWVVSIDSMKPFVDIDKLKQLVDKLPEKFIKKLPDKQKDEIKSFNKGYSDIKNNTSET